eukprot:TRINITY_DN35385_c0_g1_i1.p1 TRINITY_DN35385_c0_g1~~TRINITY_DN35385_c0_g1_i1.p1  ORF type:complete len:294 (+),score=67.98 TRINITY_DN35385_c0_g1_i1:118-999(+)
MEKSESTQSLTSTLQRPRALGMSRSSPCMTAAYSLRQYSTLKKRLPTGPTRSSPTIVLDKIDLIGGNGSWRQRLAEDEFARRAIEEEQRRREQLAAEEEKRRRKAEREMRRRLRQEEEERRRAEERERQRIEQLEREEARRQAEEAERLRLEQEEREWLARQPKTCQTCSGSGKCPVCLGSGVLHAVYLSSKADNRSTKGAYGRILQGCSACYGFEQNLMAGLKQGTGRCAACDGWGKIKPEVSSPVGGRTRKASTPHLFGTANVCFFGGDSPKATSTKGGETPIEKDDGGQE